MLLRADSIDYENNSRIVDRNSTRGEFMSAANGSRIAGARSYRYGQFREMSPTPSRSRFPVSTSPVIKRGFVVRSAPD